MNNKPEHTADISAELRDLSRSAEYCELQPKVFGKPIARYFGELADRIDAATASEAMRLKEALAYLEHVGETGDGRLHFSDMVRVGNAKAMLKIIIAHRETESTVHNCNCVPQTVHNMAAMRDALVRIEKTAQAARTCNANEDVLRDVYLEDIIKLCTTVLAAPPRNFGNARLVRNLFDDARTNQAKRLASEADPDVDELKALTLQDMAEPIRKQLKELKGQDSYSSGR